MAAGGFIRVRRHLSLDPAAARGLVRPAPAILIHVVRSDLGREIEYDMCLCTNPAPLLHPIHDLVGSPLMDGTHLLISDILDKCSPLGSQVGIPDALDKLHRSLGMSLHTTNGTISYFSSLII